MCRKPCSEMFSDMPHWQLSHPRPAEPDLPKSARVACWSTDRWGLREWRVVDMHLPFLTINANAGFVPRPVIRLPRGVGEQLAASDDDTEGSEREELGRRVPILRTTILLDAIPSGCGARRSISAARRYPS